MPEIQQSGATEDRGLGARATAGFALLSGQAALTKVVGLASQLVLAAILFPEDFGLVALVMSIVAFSSILQGGGVGQVLIQRSSAFDEWAPSAFWLSVLQGALASIVLIVAAPLSAAAYGEPALVGLMMIAAIAPPFTSLGLVSEARLQVSFRFGMLAGTEVLIALLQAAVAITLALGGFGAVSLIAALPIVAAVRATILVVVAPPPIRRPDLHRWRSLFSGSIYVLVATFAYTASAQSAVIALGRFGTTAEVGLFFFAFNISVQAVALLTARLQVVLLPTLSGIDDDVKRRVAVARRTTAGLALVTIPAYGLLLLLARPLLSTVYSERWDGAIPLLIVLSVAMAARSVTPPAGILLMANGRFRTYMWMHVVSAAVMVVVMVPAVAAFGAIGAAWAVAVHAYFALAFSWMVATSDRRGELQPLAKALGLIALAGTLAVLGALAARQLVVQLGFTGDGLDIVVVVVTVAVIYGAVVWKYLGDTTRDVLAQFSSMLRRS